MISCARSSRKVPYTSLAQRAALRSFMASMYTDTMMPMITFFRKTSTPQIPLQMPPVRLVSRDCAQGRMWLSRYSRALS